MTIAFAESKGLVCGLAMEEPDWENPVEGDKKIPAAIPIVTNIRLNIIQIYRLFKFENPVGMRFKGYRKYILVGCGLSPACREFPFCTRNFFVRKQVSQGFKRPVGYNIYMGVNPISFISTIRVLHNTLLHNPNILVHRLSIDCHLLAATC